MPLPARLRSLLTRLRGSGLAADSAWGLVFEVATLSGTVLSFLLLGRTLGAEGYGGYATLYAIVGPLVTLAAAGVVLAVLEHIVRDHEPLPETARSCLTLTLVLGLLLTVVGGAAAAAIVETVAGIAIASILLTEFVTSPVVQVSAGVVQAGTSYSEAAKLRLVLVVARMSVLVLLFVADQLTIVNFGLGMLLVSGILGLRSLVAVGRRYGFRFTPGPVHLRHLKTNGLYSTAISAASLNHEGDKLVLAANGFVVDTGLYAAAYRIVSFGFVPIVTLTQSSHRRFLEHEQGRKGQHLSRSLRFGAVAGGYGFVFGVALFVFAPLLPLLMGEDFEGSVVMVRWLSPIVMLRALAIFPLNGLMGLGRTGLRTSIVVVNAVVAMAMYLVLVPIHGWEGAAIGTLISETLNVISVWIALLVCQRRADRDVDLLPEVPLSVSDL